MAQALATLAPQVRLRVGRLGLSIPDLAAMAVIGMAAAIRIALIAQGWPELNSDEAVNGLMALHIVGHGEFPIFVYGQAYVGAAEAYLAAPLFLLFGTSDFALRLGQVVFCASFLGALYLLARLLYDRKVALVSITLLSLGTLEMLFRQLEASGGYMETLLCATVALLLASWLVLSAPHRAPDSRSQASRQSRSQTARLAAYAGLGLAWGLGFWSHFVVLSAVLASAVLLLWFCRDELRTRATLWLLAGLFVGLLPVILHDLSSFPDQTAVGTLFKLYATGGTGATNIQATLGQRLTGALLVGLPIFTGARPVCALPPQEAWPLSPHVSTHTVLCSTIHGAWSGGLIALWLLAATRAVVAVRRWRAGSPRSLRPAVPGSLRPAVPDTRDRPPPGALQGCRLAVLGAAGLTAALYIVSPAPAVAPRPSARYLIELWVAVPCLVAILLSPPGRGRLATILSSGRVGIMAALLAGMTLGTIDTFHQIPYTQWKSSEQYALIDNLKQIGATRIYTDYWTCYRMVYQSRERIICSVLDQELRPYQNRYLAYSEIVRHDPRAAYVFPLQSPYATVIARRMKHTGQRFRRFVFNFYVVYQPV